MEDYRFYYLEYPTSGDPRFYPQSPDPHAHRPEMAAAGQYNYPPPPPPPPGPPPHQNSFQQQQPQFGYQQQQSQYPPRGGGQIRGRGGNHGRDFHAQGLHNLHQHNYPPHAQGQPQGLPNGQFGPHSPAQYIGPQAPGPQGGSGGGYSGPGPQWQQHDQQQNHQQHGPSQPYGPPQPALHGGAPQSQHNGSMHQGPQPATPLSVKNYHPNFAQGYNYPPQQFGPPQSPYSHPSQSPQGGPPQWSGPPNFNNRGRGRGGFNNAPRGGGGGGGGHEAPLMGPPIRMGFDNEPRGDQMAQAGNGFSPQYANHQQNPVSIPMSQSAYSGFPAQNFGQRTPSFDFNNSHPNRGRGNTNFRGRGRGDFNQFRGRDNRQFSAPAGFPPVNANHPSNVVQSKPAVAGQEPSSKKNKKKRRTNTLGLTPNGVDHEESEEEVDDVDEEARLVTLLGPDTPQLPNDLNAWLAERKARYPTKARIEAAIQEARRRSDQAARELKAKEQSETSIKTEPETKVEKAERKAQKLRLELEKAERKAQKLQQATKRKRDENDDGEEERGQVSDEDSDDTSGSSDSKPDTESSRNAGPVHYSQPPKAQLQRHCKYFSTGGTCGKKGKCRFVHDHIVRTQALKDKEANGGKMTLAQRLVLNDTAKDDLTILKSIKYLKEKGLMVDQPTASATEQDEDNYQDRHENLNYGE
ncbi:hypothetical protein B7494_g8044 [Chlorociboria aeruginascens]|nr:hypothetical protein B7494_g8044 [Chlorociboria aeruginascens]